MATHVFKFLENGSNAIEINGNYASADDDFEYRCPADAVVVIERLIVSAEDTTGMQAGEYGNIGSALTNGITLKHIGSDGAAVITDYMDGTTVKTNADWARVCYDVDLKTWGAGNEVLTVRWTLSKAGIPLVLRPSEYIRANFNDDLTGLISHRFMIQGYSNPIGSNRSGAQTKAIVLRNL